MCKPLIPHFVTLPTGRSLTIEADSEENARAAAALEFRLYRLPPGTTVVTGPAAQARAFLKDLRVADYEIVRLQQAAEDAGLHDCAQRLREADAQLICAASLLHESRTDTDLSRALGTFIEREVA